MPFGVSGHAVQFITLCRTIVHQIHATEMPCGFKASVLSRISWFMIRVHPRHGAKDTQTDARQATEVVIAVTVRRGSKSADFG
jgi:hypothetical protein